MGRSELKKEGESLLRVEDLSKSFGGVLAVDGVSFELPSGQLLGIIGPNGSGKTTLVNLITGFIKPDRGRVIYSGNDITGWPPYKIVTLGIARTFQMVKPFYQLPAYKNLIIPLCSPRVKAMAGGKYGERDAVALDLLEEVGCKLASPRIPQATGTGKGYCFKTRSHNPG